MTDKALSRIAANTAVSSTVSVDTDMVVTIGVSAIEERYHRELDTVAAKRKLGMDALSQLTAKIKKELEAISEIVRKAQTEGFKSFADSLGIKYDVEVATSMSGVEDGKVRASVEIKVVDPDTGRTSYNNTLSYGLPVGASSELLEYRKAQIDLNDKLKQLSEVEGACRRGLADLGRHERQVRTRIAIEALKSSDIGQELYNKIIEEVSGRQLPDASKIDL